jgi:hypothetical protein
VVGLRVYDPREESLPSVGLLRAVDAETGAVRWVDTSSRMVRQRYEEWYRDLTEYQKQAFRQAGADSVPIRTNESYVNALLAFFQKRTA